MNEWFLNPRIHGILQNIIQVFIGHPQPLFAQGRSHHGRKIHAIASRIITNHYLILFTIFWQF
jgi:hypothetical protein